MVIEHIEIDGALNGQNVLRTAVSGKRVVLLSYVLVAAGAVNAKFQSGNTDLSGAMPLAENGGVSAAHNPHGHVQTAAGAALNLHLSGAVQVSGHATIGLVAANG